MSRAIYIIQFQFTTDKAEILIPAPRPGWSVHWGLVVGELEQPGSFFGHITVKDSTAAEKGYEEIAAAGSVPYGGYANVVCYTGRFQKARNLGGERYKIGSTELTDDEITEVMKTVTEQYTFNLMGENCQEWSQQVVQGMQDKGKTNVNTTNMPTTLKDMKQVGGITLGIGFAFALALAFYRKK